MVAKIRGKFEAEIVIWRELFWFIREPIKTTIPLHFRPLCASEMQFLHRLVAEEIIDCIEFENKMIYYALDENEKKRLNDGNPFFVRRFIEEYLSLQAKMTILKWIMSVSEFPKEEDDG